MKKSTWMTLMVILLALPGTLWLGTVLPGRWYYLTSTLVIAETMVPFFLRFEGRKPQARELVILAVMCALATVSRVAFAFLPGFKPITGIVMITGIAFGAEAGFLTGAMSAFASNFFYSQGPWTAWQMMAYGIGGWLAGLIWSKRRERGKPAVLAVYGFFAIVLVVGPLLDCSTVFTALSMITPEAVGLVFLQGLPLNVTHGLGCAATMLLFSRPLLEKLDRLKRKYGMLEE